MQGLICMIYPLISASFVGGAREAGFSIPSLIVVLRETLQGRGVGFADEVLYH